MIRIAPDELQAWSKYIYEITGISLDESKGYLLETRMDKLLRETASASFSELFYKVKSDFSTLLRRRVIESITTNETSFFRDTAPFDLLLNKVIPDLIDRRIKALGNARQIPIRIWSAACSSGQEVYSIGIVLKELLGDLSRWDIRIVGTDISDKVVAQASYGLYNKFELERGMTGDRLAKYFIPQGSDWKIGDEIRALATFKTMNLLEPFVFPYKFDIVLCRNVAIYFGESDKLRLFNAIGRAFATDGVLIIGSTESILGLCPEFEAKRYMRAVFYQKKN
jgi:chemotaxis protein methyltransferase CheR